MRRLIGAGTTARTASEPTSAALRPEEERSLHAGRSVEAAVVVDRAATRELDLHRLRRPRLQLFVDVETVDRERVGGLALVVELDGDRGAGRRLHERGLE